MAAPTPVQRTLSDGPSKTVRLITIPAGGDADVAETICIDTSALTGGNVTATTHTINKIIYGLNGFSITLSFDATSDVHAITIPPGGGTLDFSDMGGISNNAGSGITGDITFITNGIAAADDDDDDNIGFFVIETLKVV